MIYVAEVSYYDTGDSTVKTAYFSTGAFVTGSSDTPAHTAFQPRIVSPALVRRDVFDVGTMSGQSRVGYGELVLRNNDGALDDFNTYGLDGRALVVRVADSASAAYPSAWTTVLRGTMEQMEVSFDQVRVRVRDRQIFAAAAVQPNRYGGTNVLPEGVDGLDSDLKGKPKPLVYGAVFNAEPVAVNTSRLIFQVHDGALRDVTAVYDSGALLTHGDDYASQAAMEATAPAAGAFRVWKAGGMFRLGSSPSGQVTCDAVQGLAPRNRTAAALFRTVLESAGLTTEQISAPDCVALDAANSATLGLYVREDVLAGEVLDDIARSVGAWWAADADGVVRIQRLDAPSGSPVLDIDTDMLIDGSLQRVPLNDGGLPVYRVTVRAAPNWTVQTAGLVGVVGAARRARLAQPFQDAVDTDATVQTAYLLAPELTVESRLSCLTAADTEATRLLTLHKVKRDRLELRVHGTAATLGLIDLGVVVQITAPRFGLTAGKLFRVLGYQLDATAGTASLTVWG